MRVALDPISNAADQRCPKKRRILGDLHDLGVDATLEGATKRRP